MASQLFRKVISGRHRMCLCLIATVSVFGAILGLLFWLSFNTSVGEEVCLMFFVIYLWKLQKLSCDFIIYYISCLSYSELWWLLDRFMCWFIPIMGIIFTINSYHRPMLLCHMHGTVSKFFTIDVFTTSSPYL